MSTALARQLSCAMALSAMLIGQLHAEAIIDSETNRVILGLPAGTDVHSEMLAVQYDGYDVTELTIIDGGQIYVQFPGPIAPGNHSIQVLEFGDDGSISTLIDEQVQVASQEYSTSWYANVGFNQRYRLNDKNYPEEASVGESTGSIRYGVETTGDGQRLEASFDGVYDAASQNNSDLNEWAIAQYKLLTEVSGDDLKGGFTFGHIQAKRESLLFSSFERRGIGFDFGTTDEAYQTQVFATRSEQTTRYDGELSVPNDSDERTVGAVASAEVWDEHLIVSASYIDAKTDLGEDDPFFRTVYGGDAWGAALDSFWFSNQLWLHLEHAESTFDSDGLGIGEEEKRDEAQQAVVQINSGATQSFLDYWNAEFRYQEVGEDYYSIGNFSLPGDIRVISGRAEAALSSVRLSYETSVEETNIDDQTDRVSQELDVSTIALGYSPSVETEEGLWSWVGAPGINLRRTQSDNTQPFDESVLFGFDLDQTTTEYALELNFDAMNFYWGISAQDIDIDDNAQEIILNNVVIFEPGPDQSQRSYSAFWGWQFSDKTFLNLYGDVSRQKEKELENVFKSRSFGIEGQLELLEDKADFQFAYSRSFDESEYRLFEDFNSEFQSDYGSAKLVWHWSKAEHNRPNIDTFLSGTWSQDEDKLASDRNEQWAIFMGIDIAYAGGN